MTPVLEAACDPYVVGNPPEHVLHKPTIFNDDDFDVDAAMLSDTLNAIPGIETEFSCTGHKAGSVSMYYAFKVHQISPDPFLPLRFIAACVAKDRDIWISKSGGYWSFDIWYSDAPSDLSVGGFVRGSLRLSRTVTRKGSEPVLSELECFEATKHLIRTMNTVVRDRDWLDGHIGKDVDPEAAGFTFDLRACAVTRLETLRNQRQRAVAHETSM